MMLPFSSGHLLGLRVFPQNDFAPYRSVWHCTPEGNWSIYNDGPSLETTCPRWWGPALRHAELTDIELQWPGPNELQVTMEEPGLVWKMRMATSPLLRTANSISSSLPLRAWKLSPFVRLQEWMAKQLFNMGNLRFSFITPSGKKAVIIPQQIYFIRSSKAIWKGQALGQPARLPKTPLIGKVPLPKYPVFMIGQAYARIDNPDEFRRTRERVVELPSPQARNL
ncbi:MAG: hypothetical protein KDD06_26360 [Phaeodactylibacter sp.]|nr:hypothetical protein [Phaeodactylibacter sp.]